MGWFQSLILYSDGMKILKFILVVLALSVVIFFAYFNNTKLTNPTVANYYSNLERSLTEKGYSNSLLVISSKRFKWENDLFQKISVAAPNSNHLSGNAIDFLVFDINSDGEINVKDVDIVFEILDNEIVKDKGGVGIYKNRGLLTRQMIHMDCRGYKARWGN